MENNVLSYHGKPELKAWAVAAAKRHRDLDMLMAGAYGAVLGDNKFHGCSVGCDAYEIIGDEVDTPHKTTAAYFGFPLWLEYLRDQLFEGLPEPDRYDFHPELKEAIPVGADLEPVRHKLAIRRMDRLIALQQMNTGHDTTPVIAAIKKAIACHEAELAGESCDLEAALSEALSVELSAAQSEELSVAWSAAAAARSIGRWAQSASYQQERDDLLAILRELDQEKADD